MKVAIGYCPSCTQKGLAMLDVATEHAETLTRIKNAIKVQGALGGPLEAMTEICFLLDMPMPAKREPEKYDDRWAMAALDMPETTMRMIWRSRVDKAPIGSGVCPWPASTACAATATRTCAA